ncbi:MAG: sugar phosphate isomerase/epimerase [Phycisphaerales bacterium]|nr:MAG: sugar phosphate isomerase/epimerase [Phycisphaerales bacterium]
MKIGFSSATCPQWDLKTMVEKAAEFGFDGLELNGVQSEVHLPHVSELADDSGQARNLFEKHNVQLVCLSCSATLDAKAERQLTEARARIVEYIELAGSHHCPFVRILPGRVQRRDHHRIALSRIAEAIRSLVKPATEQKVTLLIENGDDFVTSDSLWFVVDAVNHPAVRCCWNQCTALLEAERPTKSIPRLGQKLGLIHLCDGEYKNDRRLLTYTALGEGRAEIARQIEILKGIAYSGYLMASWPKNQIAALQEPEEALPKAAEYLRQRLNEEQTVLTAYKGDKNAPKYTSRRAPAFLSEV